jgi:hypothetical protein
MYGIWGTTVVASGASKKFWEERIAYFPWYDTERIENDTSHNSSIVPCIRCRGDDFTEQLPSNRMKDTHTNTDWRKGFMKYVVEMGSGAIIYISSFIKIGLDIRSWWGGHTQTALWPHTPTFIYQNKESRLKVDIINLLDLWFSR